MSIYRNSYLNNVGRVENLLNLYEAIKATNKRPSVKEADILRAAIVFLHAAFEDYLRAIITEWLPKRGDKTSLCNISLAGQGGHTGKFTIAELKDYDDLSVKELISRSVTEHMNQVSFNDVKDICTQLHRIGIETENFQNYSGINTMIKRRHRIVHEMDRNPKNGKGQHHAASISSGTIRVWISCVSSLINEIDNQILSF